MHKGVTRVLLNQTPTLASYETSNTSTAFRLESNVRGDVVALRDELGTLFARYFYSEYGVIKGVAITATDQISLALARDIAQRQPLRYGGYVYDDYSQMYYCAARYYDPATQVFVSLDPARADGERSGYLYCGGDPVNSVDPSGLSYYYHLWRLSSVIRSLAVGTFVKGAIASRLKGVKPYKKWAILQAGSSIAKYASNRFRYSRLEHRKHAAGWLSVGVGKYIKSVIIRVRAWQTAIDRKGRNKTFADRILWFSKK